MHYDLYSVNFFGFNQNLFQQTDAQEGCLERTLVQLVESKNWKLKPWEEREPAAQTPIVGD